MAKKEIKVYECQCERCQHKWITRSEELPIVCPNCKSPYWNKPKNKKINIKGVKDGKKMS